MRDDQIIDEVIECLDLLSQTPAMPANPQTALIRAKIVDLKLTRLRSKKKFADFFANLSQVIKQIGE